MEPERRIEKVLRAFAKKRRDEAGASLELRPATRRLLQDEVARRAPKRSEDNFFLNLFAILRRGLVVTAGVAVVLVIVAALFLPALTASKSRSATVLASSNLRQIGEAVQMFASQNNRTPASLDELKSELGAESVLIDPISGKRFVYVGGANSRGNGRPSTVLAYSPEDNHGRLVLFGDGRVEKVTSSQFAELSSRGVEVASAEGIARAPSTDALAPAASRSIEPPPVLDKEKAQNQLTAGDTDVPSLETRKLIPLEAEQNSSHGSAAPAVARKDEVVASDSKQASTTTVTGGTVAVDDSNILALRDSAGRPGAGSNVPGNVADSLQVELTAGTANQTSPPIPGSETAAASKVAVNEPRSVSVAESELPASQKMTPQQASAQGNNKAALVFASQQYAQMGEAVRAQYREKKIAAPVLASFEVQQNNQSIRVVDQDGSVYNGYWRAEDAPNQNQKVPQPMPAIPPTASIGLAESDRRENKDWQQPAAGNYYFQVIGTNQSLRQNIVFTGNFTAVTNGMPLVQKSGNGFSNGDFVGGGAGVQNASSNQSVQLLLSNGRISGTAIIDNIKEIQINALPIIPP